MNLPEYDIVAAAGIRRALVPSGDIREDIAFQNDINLLLARLDAGATPLKALGWIREAVTAEPTLPTEPMLRIIRGGGEVSRPAHSPHSDPFVGRVAIAVGQ
jgi:hypothetical protein